MASPATLVTALYDLGRGEMEPKGNNFRPFSHYLEWFKHLLHLNCPIVIFIPPLDEKESGGYNLSEFIKQHRRSEYSTAVVIRSFSSLSLFSKRSRIQGVMEELNHDLVNLEFHCPDYIIIIYSKFDFLLEVTQKNPFNTTYFFWVDAGYFRTVPRQELEGSWPDPYKLRHVGDRFLLQDKNQDMSIISSAREDLSADELKYLRRCPNEILATFFGGRSKVIETVRSRALRLLDVMLDQGLINNEQQVLSVLIRRDSSLFFLYPYVETGRNLIVDLSYFGFFQFNYPTCPHLNVLTVATREIKDHDLNMWTKSAHYYGYVYDVIGRSESWGGWQFRTRKYLDHLRRINGRVETAILTDSTDLFFCGPAWEAYDKFKEGKSRIVIGGESMIAYNSLVGNHDLYKVERFFINRCTSRFCFPNGGFVMGYVTDLIKLLEANLISSDDQTGYMDLLIDQKIQYHLDEETALIGNIPNHHLYKRIEEGVWKWDSSKGRYYNSLTHQYPIAFHFSGHNHSPQKRMFGHLFPPTQQRRDVYGPNWVWWIVILLLLIFLLSIFWSFRRHT